MAIASMYPGIARCDTVMLCCARSTRSTTPCTRYCRTQPLSAMVRAAAKILAEIQHIRPDGIIGLGARPAGHLVVRSRGANQLGDYAWVVGLVIGGDWNSGV